VNTGVALILAASMAGVAASRAHDLWIEQVTVVSAERTHPLADVNVKIHDGKIVEIARAPLHGRRADTEILEGKGLFLTPGLIDGHVHLREIPGMRPDQEQAHPDIAHAAREQFPKSYLYFGFTTLVDLNATPKSMAAWNAHKLRPDTYFCGAAPIVDGYPMMALPKPIRYDAMPYFLIEPEDLKALPANIDAAAHTPEAVVARMKADGAICVKTYFERGFGAHHDLRVPRLNTIEELVLAAHAAGLPVLLHANSADAQRFGIQAGTDIFAHGMWNWNEPDNVTVPTPPVTRILRAVIDAKRGYQPTIEVLYGERNLFDDEFLAQPMLTRALPMSLIEWYKSREGQWYREKLAQLIQATSGQEGDVDGRAIARVNHVVAFLAARDARFSFGSDTPSDATYANPPGLNGWLEMHRLIDAGMSPAQLFKAATLANAAAFRMSREIGSVEVGKQANLLLLRADPTLSIRAYDHIQRIILHGSVIDPAELAANGRDDLDRGALAAR
jgi:imidazolonepropionase-like amidohydrolase